MKRFKQVYFNLQTLRSLLFRAASILIVPYRLFFVLSGTMEQEEMLVQYS